MAVRTDRATVAAALLRFRPAQGRRCRSRRRVYPGQPRPAGIGVIAGRVSVGRDCRSDAVLTVRAAGTQCRARPTRRCVASPCGHKGRGYAAVIDTASRKPPSPTQPTRPAVAATVAATAFTLRRAGGRSAHGPGWVSAQASRLKSLARRTEIELISSRSSSSLPPVVPTPAALPAYSPITSSSEYGSSSQV